MREVRSVLVTGGAGFMGRDFIRLLLSLKEIESVVCLDALTYAGKKENIELFFQDPRFTFIHGNILDQALVEEIVEQKKIEAIVHFAAETHVDRSLAFPLEFVETNIKGTATLLEVVRKNRHVFFHHVSTDEVYGSLGDSGRFTESSPYNPSSPYSASKAASDHLVLAYARTYQLLVTVSHASNNYGPFQLEEKLIPKLIEALKRKTAFPLYGNGQNRREWTFVEDHSAAVFSILRKGERQQVYNIGTGEERTNLEVIEQVIKEFSHKTGQEVQALFSCIQFVSDRLGHDYRYAVSSDRIRQLGWRPCFSFQAGLSRTIDYYLSLQEVG